MAIFWKDAGWCCRTHRPMHHADLIGLIHLYQPIVGSQAISLYLTLVYQVPLHRAGISEMHTHSYLLQLCSFTYDELLEARYLLEGIGLVNTYEIRDDDQLYYEYELIPPLTPAKFFQSDILSISLYNSLGNERYFVLKDWFIGNSHLQKIEREQRGKNITRTFQEVFDNISPADLTKQAEREKEMAEPVAKIDESLHEGKLPELGLDVDFSMLEMRLSHLVDKNVWTESLKQELQEICFLYQLDDWAILKALQNPYVTSHGKIHLDRLRSFIKKEYRLQFGSAPIVLRRKNSQKSQKEKEKKSSDTKKVLSEEEKHFQQLAKISPLQLLDYYQKGARIPASDVELVESLIHQYGLPSGVVNVLLEYVLLKYDYKLPRKLVEKIAGQWKRLGIESVEGALEQAKKEEWEMKKKKTRSSSKTTAKKPEKLPHVLQMQMEQSDQSAKPESKEDWSDQQAQIRAKLRLMNERFIANKKGKEKL
ncbi:DnaD domain protein [Thermoactinomyces mirandus]|uniref:DnaD domain protein n=1 Tax=Thermoactinomyces mirandus TaxID=2756294 RepID=A0A7W1XQW3_9BACL|nr:DnaD domain protein [Thermoactinomyces mirandus]MBA4601638.1 DnaD domain protein [Thermoactinomyces mirandus]